MSDIYKLQYANNTLTYPGWNGYVCYEAPAGYPITYLSDEHVSVTGDDLYLPGNEGITLQSSYDPYYRISGYDITNGSIVDGKLVPTGPCTIKAVQKVNAFTASGTFNMPNSTITAWRQGVRSYGKLTYKTSNVPNSWSATRNNTWYTAANGSSPGPTTIYNNTTITAFVPTGTISAYNLHIYATVSAGRGVTDGRTITANSYVYVNNSYKTSAISYSNSRTPTWSKNYNVDYSNTGDFFLSAWQNYGNESKININPNLWSATGIAP